MASTQMPGPMVVVTAIDLATAFLLTGRALQGLSAACIMPASLALVKTYWDGPARQRAVSLWSIGSWGGSGVCSLFGGFMAQNFGWRYIFFSSIDPKNKDDIKKIAALNKDKATLEERLAKTDSFLMVIGGQLTEEEARQLILKKLYDLVNNELNRYLNDEKRGLIKVAENLWDKYSVSRFDLESESRETLKTLDGFLSGLGYLV